MSLNSLLRKRKVTHLEKCRLLKPRCKSCKEWATEKKNPKLKMRPKCKKKVNKEPDNSFPDIQLF